MAAERVGLPIPGFEIIRLAQTAYKYFFVSEKDIPPGQRRGAGRIQKCIDFIVNGTQNDEEATEVDSDVGDIDSATGQPRGSVIQNYLTKARSTIGNLFTFRRKKGASRDKIYATDTKTSTAKKRQPKPKLPKHSTIAVDAEEVHTTDAAHDNTQHNDAINDAIKLV